MEGILSGLQREDELLMFLIFIFCKSYICQPVLLLQIFFFMCLGSLLKQSERSCDFAQSFCALFYSISCI